MSHATPRPSSLQSLAAWLVPAAVWCSAATLGCSSRQATADASSLADVGADASLDVGGDHLVSADVLADDGWDLGQTEVVDAADVDAAEGAGADGEDGQDGDAADADGADGTDLEAVDLDAADAADLDDEDAGDLDVADGTDVDAADAADLDAADAADLDVAGGTDVDAADAVDLDVAGGTDVDAADVADLDVAGGTDVDATDAADLDVAGGTDVDAAEATDLDAADAPDSVEVLDVIAVDGDAAVDSAPGCTGTDMPAPLTGTVEFDFSPLVPNKVVTGCGKGPPQPVKEGAPGCCNCPPPYSCYCNGECGWLRAPDLVKPQNNGQAVWTGKWVVSLAESYQLFEKPSTMHLQRWQPGSGKGFELVPLPTPWLPSGTPVALLLGKKVVLASRLWSAEAGYGPKHPAYLYDPETNEFTLIKMPACFKLVAVGGTLACTKPWLEATASDPLDPGGLYLLDPGSLSWTLAPSPTSIAPKKWVYAYSERVTAKGDAVYFFGAIYGYDGPWADGSPSGQGQAEHLVKYDLATKVWTDFGAVSPQYLQDVEFIAVDHVGIVVAKYTLKAARFRLDTLKWEDAPSAPYIPHGAQELKLTPCGLLFGSGEWNGVPMNGGMTHKPLLLRNDLTWQFLPAWGYPDEYTTARKLANVVLTDKEIYMLGGMNGPPDGGFVFHKDSYRYPLAALCSGGVP